MKVIRVEQMPPGFGDYESTELADYELECVANAGVEEIRYYYGTDEYCGAGAALLLRHGVWYYHAMGHCSCYGPTDEIALTNGEPTIEELLARCSGELREQLQPLANAA